MWGAKPFPEVGELSDFDWNAAAAWVQAVGTIAALAIAIWLPRREERSQRRQARLAARSLGLRALARLNQLIELAGCGDAKVRKKTLAPELTLAELADLLDRLPLERLEPDEVSAVVGLAAICRRTRDVWVQEIEPALKNGPLTAEQTEPLRQTIELATRVAADLHVT